MLQPIACTEKLEIDVGRFVRVMILLTAILVVRVCFTIDVCNAGATEDATRAWALFASGDNNGALAIYESLIASQPDSQEISTWYYRASWCY